MKSKIWITILGMVFFVSFSNAGQLVYSTYIGGSGDEYGEGLAVDSSGNVYITGRTNSANFPTTSSGYDTSFNSNYDVFISKLNPTGSSLLFSTYLGGPDYDEARAIGLDSIGNIYITGYTASTNFPTTLGAFDRTHNGGTYDLFVTKLNATGSALIYSTFLGSSGADYTWCNEIALDTSGNIYIVGNAGAADFPTTPGAYDTTYNGGTYDAFVTKLSASGSNLVYSTFLGGSGDYDETASIAVDSSGNAYVTGITNSTTGTTFPTTPGAYDTTFNGGTFDAFVAKLNATGSNLVYSTFLGGNGYDNSHTIMLDNSNNVYVVGWTGSTNFPTTAGAYDTSYNGGLYDIFVTKLNADGSMVSSSTYLGGNKDDYGTTFTTDTSGNLYITGITWSSNSSNTFPITFPTTSNAYDTIFHGNSDIYLSELNPQLTTLMYSSLIGKTSDDNCHGIAIDNAGFIYLFEHTTSSDFPTTPGAFDTTYNGGWDLAVSKLDLSQVPVELSIFKAEVENEKFRY